MKLENFNFRDEEFRNYFNFHLPYDFKACNEELLSRISSGEFTDEDLVKLFLKLSFCNSYFFNLFDVERILFNYKISVISEERIDNFRKVCEEMHNIKLCEINYVDIKDYFFMWECDGVNKFNKLMDIFLDQI